MLRHRSYVREHFEDMPEVRLDVARVMTGAVLVVNAGSSSFKLRLLDAEDELLAARPPATG